MKINDSNLLNILLPAIVICMASSSCHKAKHTPVSPPTPAISPISGLTGMQHRGTYYPGLTGYQHPYIKWNFSGTNPIIAIPNIDTSYFGHEQLSFIGSNVTQVVFYNYYAPAIPSYPGLTINISYTPVNLIDTISFQYTDTIFGHQKVLFEYAGSHITRASVVYSSNFPDTFHWATPDYYYFSYTGNNISQITVSRYNGALPRDSEVHNYITDSRSNNFAGSIPTFLLLEFLEESTSSLDGFVLDMPFYINANILADSTNATSFYKTIVDTAGRVTERIFGEANLPASADTTFYYY